MHTEHLWSADTTTPAVSARWHRHKAPDTLQVHTTLAPDNLLVHLQSKVLHDLPAHIHLSSSNPTRVPPTLSTPKTPWFISSSASVVLSGIPIHRKMRNCSVPHPLEVQLCCQGTLYTDSSSRTATAHAHFTLSTPLGQPQHRLPLAFTSSSKPGKVTRHPQSSQGAFLQKTIASTWGQVFQHS